MKIRIEEKNYIYATAQKVRLRFYIRKMIRVILGVWYTLLARFMKPVESDRKKYYVSICAIFMNEDRYLKEWLEFHIIIGIEHFYLYNNFSDDDYMKILAPYIKSGKVTLIDWPVENGQLSAYKDCIENFKNESNWIGFIDLDEFVVPNKVDDIKEFLVDYKKHSAVMLYWRYFGTSGHMKRKSDGLTIEDFTVCWKKYSNIGKCFFNTDYEFDSDYPKNSIFHHELWGKYKNVYYPPVNVFHKYVILGDHCFPKSDLPIQINHYLLKSYEEYIDRKSKKGGGTHGVGMHDMEYLYFHESFCQGTDYHAYKYLIKTKLAIAKNKGERKKWQDHECREYIP